MIAKRSKLHDGPSRGYLIALGLMAGCARGAEPQAPVMSGAASAASAVVASAAAPQPIASGATSSKAPARVQLLTLNDFHGQLTPRKTQDGRLIGSAGVLGAWLEAARAGAEARTILVHAGDLIGASPPASALLDDKPTLAFLNRFANEACHYAGVSSRQPSDPTMLPEVDPAFGAWLDPACNIVGVVGNHEFDKGKAKLLELLAGEPPGQAAQGAWRGARYPTLAANVVEHSSGRPILPPFVVKQVDGVRVGFIGVVLRHAREAVQPLGIEGLDFLDEAESVNRYVGLLVGKNIHALVVLMHQGGEQPVYAGPTRENTSVKGDIVSVVSRLDPEVDVVVSGHTHKFTNAWLPSSGSKRVLVVQAQSAGVAFGKIEMAVDRANGDMLSAMAEVQPAWADEGPGRTPDSLSAAIQAAAETEVAPRVKEEVSTAAAALDTTPNEANESSLGDLVADAQLATAKDSKLASAKDSKLAIVNRRGLRTALPAGAFTWGDLFAIQPFDNQLLSMTITGDELKTALEQQWRPSPGGPDKPGVDIGTLANALDVAGISYAWSKSAPMGAKVRDVRVGGVPLKPTARYRVVVNDYLASGSDGFSALAHGEDRVSLGSDLESLKKYLLSRPKPVKRPPGNRVRSLP